MVFFVFSISLFLTNTAMLFLQTFCASSPYKLKIFFADSACLFLQSTLALHGPAFMIQYKEYLCR